MQHAEEGAVAFLVFSDDPHGFSGVEVQRSDRRLEIPDDVPRQPSVHVAAHDDRSFQIGVMDSA
ncbi:MAG: hypothetical protein R3E12_18880 [Candidatus Eisenbacteria bacterium]